MKRWIPVALALCLTGCGITAPGSNPGFVSFDYPAQLGLKRDTTLSLGSSVLRIAARHLVDEPEIATLAAALDGLQVGVYRVAGNSNLELVNDRVEATAQALSNADWERVVRISEDGQNVHVLVKQDERAILGVTVLVVDPEELVFVNVMGELDSDVIADIAVLAQERESIALAPSLRTSLRDSIDILSLR